MNQEHDMQIDVQHALSDFLDAYDNHAEMVVTEAIANAIDVGSTKVEISLQENLESGNNVISFHNNGPPMSKKQFEDYHVIARSSKSKGTGIGFAGIGAKVYLAAWDNAVIHTETTDGVTAYASKMFVKNKNLKYSYVKPSLDMPGTMYSVRLKRDDYMFLEGSIEPTITNTFTPAMLEGLKISLNGRLIKPWNPSTEFRKSSKIVVKQKRFPITMIVSKEDIPDSDLYIQYHVSGKVITTKKPDWRYEIKPAYAKRIHAYVDATAISDSLNLNKTGFKQGSHHIMNEIHKKIYHILKKEGYFTKDNAPMWQKNRLTKFFERLFKDPKYAFLNPNVKGGSGTSGQGRGSTRSGRSESGGPRRSKEPGENEAPRERGGGSFQLITIERPNDPRDGWLDTESNRVVINLAHPLYIKYEQNVSARNQRIATILTTVLIKNAAKSREMNPIEAFELQTELMTMAKDEMW